MFADQPLALDRAIIRIKSERKWPEKVVLDTSQPTIAPPAVEEPPAAQSIGLPPDEPGDQSNLEAMAQLKPNRQPAAVDHPTLQIKRGVARTARSKPRITRRLARAEAGGGCCQVWDGLITVKRSLMLRRRRDAASPWPMDWPALTGRN